MTTNWRDVLIAYLHDPPDKAMKIRGHETRARKYLRVALGDDVSESELKDPSDHALQMVFVGAIKGAGDTWFVLVTTILVSLLGVAACWYASRWGLMGWWYAVTGWICLLGLIYMGRFLQGRWRTMRVIETDPVHREP